MTIESKTVKVEKINEEEKILIFFLNLFGDKLAFIFYAFIFNSFDKFLIILS